MKRGEPERRPIQTMRREELVAEAQRLGVKNPDRYLVTELRPVVVALARKRG